MPTEVHLVGSEKIVITENDRVVAGSYTTSMESAEQKAQDRRKLAETAGQPSPKVEIKQTLYG
jgi:hypothetical protein